MTQLKWNDIEDKDDLVKRAKYEETWKKLLDVLSRGLEAELREWYKSASELEDERSRKRKAEKKEMIQKRSGKESVDFAPSRKHKSAVRFPSWPTRSSFEDI